MNRNSIFKSAASYAFALAAVALAVLARIAVDDYLGNRLPYAPFFVAVIAISWLCGWAPALMSAILGFLSAEWFFISPRYAVGHIDIIDVIWGGAYFLVALGTIKLIHAMQRARDQAVSHKTELEREITERNRSEEALLYRAGITEVASDALYATDADLNILVWNKSAVDLYGWNAEEVVGKHPRDLFHPRFMGKTREEVFEEVKSEGKWRGEVVNMRKDGSQITVIASINAIRDGSGNILGFAVSHTDITERKKMEQELRNSEQISRDLIRYAPAGICEVDVSGSKFIRVNEVMCRNLGYTESELLALNPFDLLREEDKAPTQERIRRRLAGEAVDEFVEHKIKGKNGREYDVMLMTTLLFSNGRPHGAVLIAQDITERKRMETELRRSRDGLEMRVVERTAKLQESEARLRTLASELINAQETERKRIAHELHDSLAAQLAAIKYRLERKLTQAESPDTTITLEEIIQDVQRANVETRRIMANLRPSVLDDIGIVAALSWFCRETQKTYPGTKIRYVGIVKEEEVPEELKIILFRVVQECVTNAIRHGKSSRILVVLDRMHPWLRLRVEDNGEGFDSEKLVKKSEKGGIGLDSMQQRVESSGGIFSISSNPGNGTLVNAEWRLN